MVTIPVTVRGRPVAVAQPIEPSFAACQARPFARIVRAACVSDAVDSTAWGTPGTISSAVWTPAAWSLVG
jgi:hypothetical protein